MYDLQKWFYLKVYKKKKTKNKYTILLAWG